MPFTENEEYRINASSVVIRKDLRLTPAEIALKEGVEIKAIVSEGNDQQVLAGKSVAVRKYRIEARLLSSQELKAAQDKADSEAKAKAEAEAKAKAEAEAKAKSAASNMPPPPGVPAKDPMTSTAASTAKAGQPAGGSTLATKPAGAGPTAPTK